MSRPGGNALLQRAELALRRSRNAREESSALRTQSTVGRELRELLRSAKNVETELENALLASSASERTEVADALFEARNLRIAIDELLEQTRGGGED